jgi:hypothetical protein
MVKKGQKLSPAAKKKAQASLKKARAAKKKLNASKAGSSAGGKKPKKRSGKPAKPRGGNRTAKAQGIASWARAIGTWVIAAIPFIIAAGEANGQAPGRKLNFFMRRILLYYTGSWTDENFNQISTDTSKMKIGWGSLAGAGAWNQGTKLLIKHAPIRTLFPRLS